MRTHFYHATTRSYMAAFATIFDDLFCTTEGGAPTPVPLRFAGRQKFAEILDGDYDKNESEFEIVLPAMAYEMTGINYAPERHLNPLHVIGKESVSFNRIPYDFSFSVYVAAKQLDDLLEITEQIIPMFTPDFTVTVNERIGSTDFQTNLTISLNSVSYDNDYLGNFDELRRIEATLSFTLKGYLYPGTVNLARIKKAVVEMYQDRQRDHAVVAEVLPRAASPGDPHVIIEGIE